MEPVLSMAAYYPVVIGVCVCVCVCVCVWRTVQSKTVHQLDE